MIAKIDVLGPPRNEVSNIHFTLIMNCFFRRKRLISPRLNPTLKNPSLRKQALYFLTIEKGKNIINFFMKSKYVHEFFQNANKSLNELSDLKRDFDGRIEKCCLLGRN